MRGSRLRTMRCWWRRCGLQRLTFSRLRWCIRLVMRGSVRRIYGWMRALRSSCRCYGWSRAQGREAALQHLQAEAKTLALAEPVVAQSSGRVDEGQSLIGASDEVYYRTKAAAVLWMLRTLVGDDSLKRALRTYRSDKLDGDPKEFQHVVERVAKRDLSWFFDDWVYRDRGLPDLSIASVTPRALEQMETRVRAGWLRWRCGTMAARRQRYRLRCGRGR